MAGDGCLLVMVMDVHPQLSEAAGPHTRTYLDACFAYANIHLASSAKNTLAVIAANHRETRFLYPPPHAQANQVEHQKDGRLELLGQINESIETELRTMMVNDAQVQQTESLISGAIGRGLLYIKRQESEFIISKRVRARMLIVKISTDTGGQYLNYINNYLTAQKIGTAIDVCLVGGDCGLLQQGTDITGGYYHCIQDVTELLQTLIMMYQADIPTRKRLRQPAAESVDYRAACFCHRTLVDMANVCSNCLSVYCKLVPLCTTCNVIFQTDRPLMKNSRKKK